MDGTARAGAAWTGENEPPRVSAVSRIIKLAENGRCDFMLISFYLELSSWIKKAPTNYWGKYMWTRTKAMC
jgi:hypothetical protein